MALVEVIPGLQTSEDTVAEAKAFAKGVGRAVKDWFTTFKTRERSPAPIASEGLC
jgi:3-hydroxyacyl-CoA dehydrogenase